MLGGSSIGQTYYGQLTSEGAFPETGVFLFARLRQQALSVKQRKLSLQARKRAVELNARSTRFMADIEVLQHAKYRKETYPLIVNFATRPLRTSQAIISAAVTATDVNGEDVSNDLLGVTTIDTPRVSVILNADVGTIGQLYTLRFVAETQDDTIEQVVILEVK